MNPVLPLYYGRPPVKVVCDGTALPPSEFCFETVGEDLLLWIDRILKAETTLEIIPA